MSTATAPPPSGIQNPVAAPGLPTAAYDEDTAFVLDWQAIRGRLERAHGIKLPEDDPLLITGEMLILAWQKAGKQISRQTAEELKLALVEFSAELEVAAKPHREAAHRDIMALSVIAQGHVAAASKESVTQIKAVTAELLQSARELKLQDRHMRWHDWFIGGLMVATVLAVGVAIGLYIWH